MKIKNKKSTERKEGRYGLCGGLRAVVVERCHQRFLTMQLPPASSWSSQPGVFAPNIHNPHETKCGGKCYVSGWPVPFSAHHAKIKQESFKLLE